MDLLDNLTLNHCIILELKILNRTDWCIGSGCGFFKINAGLKQLTISCADKSNVYNLPPKEDGYNIAEAVSKLTEVLQNNYSVLPNCTQSTGVYFGDYCQQIVFYTQQACTFQIPSDEIYDSPCSGTSLISSFLMVMIIVWVCIV